MSIICGLDPSLTSAGICVLTDGTPSLLTSIGHRSTDGASYANRSDRIVSQCRAVIDTIDRQLDLAVIEGPAYSRNLPSAFDRAGLFWGLYSSLRARKVPTAVVTPTARASFATGKGRAEKQAILAAVRGWWPQIHVANHDQADAAVLALMGTCHLGDPLPFEPKDHHRNTLDAVAWPTAKEPA